MILAFGGTTEGRKTVEVLEEAGNAYYYSTRSGEQQVELLNGIRLEGQLDTAKMTAFCREHHIGLLIDAAHPFAIRLHQTIVTVAQTCGIPVVRYERIYPPRDHDITWIDDYADIPRDIHTLLATTGVQSIGRLKPLEAEGMHIVYRILPRPSSLQLAHAQGATDDQLCYYEEGSALGNVGADAVLMKESGTSGGFAEKVAAARAAGMRIVALRRPPYPSPVPTVDGPCGLRRMVEKLLPTFFPLHSGLTTGTCATAAARAAATRLLDGQTPAEVPVVLPDGETIHVPVGYADGYAFCIKQAGDDPDVTDGLEIRATVSISEASLSIDGGEGVGRFTLPGFDYPPGEAAINKGPRQMITQNLAPFNTPLNVVISVPRGAEVARRTFNPRLGIEGGISIIGVSGIVKPFSQEAFISSISKCMQVAAASGAPCVVINSGGKSEHFLRNRYPTLPQQAFVQYGNYIGPTLTMAHELGIARIELGIMLGKAVKLAGGQLDTHSRNATMDRAFVQQMLNEAQCQADISKLTLARELWDVLSPEQAKRFASTVISHCQAHCQPLLPNGHLSILLIHENGTIFTKE